MKKILSLILILTMILSVSSVAMAAGACTTDGCTTLHVASIGTAEYHSLQEAIDAAVNGDTITLLTDCSENVTVTQQADVVITIDGNKNNGITMSGTITVDGKSQAYATAELTIQNFKFSADNISKPAYINMGVSGDNNTRYVSNLTVKDCTFAYTGTGKDVAAIKSYTGGDKNLTITRCKVDSKMHSLLQVVNVTGVVIDGCIVNSKNGINLNSSSNIEIMNSNISTNGYAVRIGVSGGTSGAVALTNNTLKSKNEDGDATIIIRGTAATQVDLDMTGNVVSGNTHISGNTVETKISADANYWDGEAAPKTGSSGTPIAVTSYYKDEAKTDLAFSSGSVAKIGNVGYPSLAAAVAAANDGDTITLLTDCSGDGIVIDKDITIDFAGHTYTVSGKLVGSTGTETSGFQILKDNEVTLKNGTLTSSETAYKPNPSDENNKSNTPCRILVQNYADLTLKDMVLDGSKCKAGLYTLSNNYGTIVIDDTEITAPDGGVAFDVYDYSDGGYTPAPEVTVKGNSNINGKIEKTGAATLEIESGYFSEDPSAYVVGDALVAKVAEGTDNIYAVGEDAIEGIAEAAAAANADITITVTRGSGELELPEGTTVKVAEGVAGTVIVNGKTLKAGETYTVPVKKSGNGIKVKYEGGNSFSTSKSAVPTSVEIDGVPVPFSGDGKFFTVGCIDPNAQWVTVRWNSTSVTTNFNPDVTVSCPNLGIPKTGDMSVWAAIAQLLGF